MQLRNISILTAIALISFSTNINACLPPPKINKQVKEVVNHLVGIMDTTQQAEINPKSPSVRMTTCKVIVDLENDNPTNLPVYLYQEQAMIKSLDKPYRQRFLRLAMSKNNTVESAGFKPNNPEKLIGLCDKSAPERVFHIEDIGKSECSVFLRKEKDNYIGETQPGGCPTNYRGAVKITNKIIFHSSGMDTYDRGLDANGKVIWGAKDEPYKFMKKGS